MIENVLGHAGTALFGIISICIFFAFFTGMLLWALRLKPSYLKTMQELPLEPNESRPASVPHRPQEQPHE
ncbi:MAG TPA: hypothetical protein VG167_10600 [Verrucomicrobiae bacterium]|nr:hypothetical protein [Verrucomicrobiae bacterium]